MASSGSITLGQTIGASGPPTGAASGDLFNSYPGPSVKSAHTTGNVLSADFTQRLLYSPLNSTVDWGQCVLKKSSNGNRSIDWNAQVLQTDILGPIASSLDWGQRTLLDNNGTSQCVNWGSRLLCYSDSSTALNWQTGNWSYPGGNTAFSLASGALFDFTGLVTVSFTNYYLSDADSFSSLDWNQRQFFDFSGNTTIDYGGRLLLTSAGSNSISWEDAHLIDPVSDSTTVDWSSAGLFLRDAGGTTSIQWGARTMQDSAGSTQFSWSTAGIQIPTKISSFGGVSTFGLGVPALYYSNTLTGQLASITTTNMFTPVSGGLFRVTAYLACTSAGSTATVAAAIQYHDDVNNAVSVNAVSVTNITLNATTAFATGSTILHSHAGTAISFTATVGGTIGTGRYLLAIALEQLI